MGQSSVWYTDEPEDNSFKKKVLDYIANIDMTPLPHEARIWIFQANPKLFNIDLALTTLGEIRWSVTAYKDEIDTGDHVFVWRSGADAGIVAEGTVMTPPTMMDELEEALPFALEPEKFKGLRLRVQLRIDHVITPPLPRDLLRADVRLAELSILRNAQGTNFAVTMAEAEVIRELLEGQQHDEDEVPVQARVEPGDGSSRVWAYAPGRKAEFWEEFYREEIMAIGWDDLGDLRQYPDLEAVAKKLIEVYQLKGYPKNDSRACYDFRDTMQPGDRVIVKRGRDEVVGYGLITGDYEYRPERATYRNVRRVRWERRGNWKCKPLFAVKDRKSVV